MRSHSSQICCGGTFRRADLPLPPSHEDGGLPVELVPCEPVARLGRRPEAESAPCQQRLDVDAEDFGRHGGRHGHPGRTTAAVGSGTGFQAFDVDQHSRELMPQQPLGRTCPAKKICLIEIQSKTISYPFSLEWIPSPPRKARRDGEAVLL